MKKLCCLLSALVLILTASVAFARTETEVETLNLIAAMLEEATAENAESWGSVNCGFDEEHDAFIVIMNMRDLTTEQLKGAYNMGGEIKDTLVASMKLSYDAVKEALDAVEELDFSDVTIMVLVCGNDGDIAMAYSLGMDITEMI